MKRAIVQMSDAEFGALRGLVGERTGLDLKSAQRYVAEGRLAPRLAMLGLDGYAGYVRYLEIAPHREEEIEAAIGLLRPQEACFLRDRPQLEVLENEVLPRLIREREASRRLRLWVPCCGTGEEAYTLAILAHEALGERAKDWEIEVLGTDVSRSAIEVARGSEYPVSSLRSAGGTQRRRWFGESNGRCTVSQTLRESVRFERADLREDLAARRLGTWDVILWRDTLIHLDEDARSRCCRVVSERLSDDGVLMIGRAETLGGEGTLFERMDRPQGFAYMRRQGSALRIAA